jgi:hypothetical protein
VAEAPAAEAPPAETASSPPEPVTPSPRTLQDIYNDVQANKPVPPAEYQALEKYAADVRARDAAEAERKQKLATLIPDTAQGILEDITSRYSFDDDQKLVLQALIEKRLLHGDDALKGKAEEAILGHHVNTQAGQLYAYLGGEANPNALPYLRNLKPEQYIASAFDAGRILARNQLVATGEYVSKKDHDAAIALAKETKALEGESLNPERTSPAPGGGAVAARSQFADETTLSEAWNAGKITRVQYAAEYKRLTGRTP